MTPRVEPLEPRSLLSLSGLPPLDTGATTLPPLGRLPEPPPAEVIEYIQGPRPPLPTPTEPAPTTEPLIPGTHF